MASTHTSRMENSTVHAVAHARKKGWLDGKPGKIQRKEHHERPETCHIMRQITPPNKVLLPNMECVVNRPSHKPMHPFTALMGLSSPIETPAEVVLDCAMDDVHTGNDLSLPLSQSLCVPKPSSPSLSILQAYGTDDEVVKETSMPFCEPRASPKQLTDILSIPLPEKASFTRDLEGQEKVLGADVVNSPVSARRWWWPF